MKKLLNKLNTLSVRRRIEIGVAVLLTVALIVSIPAYSWFSNQRKAAEMFKVEYPNSLYINAAHREDRIFFNLDAININEYKLDPITKEQIVDEHGEPYKVDKFMYAFSVSGSNSQRFLLQMGHTTNNQFTYTVYEATQYRNESDARAAVTDGEGVEHTDRIVSYITHPDSHQENKLQITWDRYNEEEGGTDGTLYYVLEDDVHMSPLNQDTPGTAARSGREYDATYGGYSRVQTNAIPLYWQKLISLRTSEIDVNKNFCKYFILVVTWDEAVQALQEKKESDLVYFSVLRR